VQSFVGQSPIDVLKAALTDLGFVVRFDSLTRTVRID
jgi:hypothetical protein